MHSFTRSPRLLIVAALALLPPLYFFQAVIGQVLLAPGDGWFQNLGVRVLMGQMLAHGQLPLWNPFIFAGMPLLATVYPGALYPPNLLYAIFPPGLATNVVVITTFHIALVGTYVFGRRVGLMRMGAMAAGLIFAFGGFMITHIGHTSRIAAAAWLPCVLLAIEELYRSARWRWVALGSLFVTLQFFAGEPQMSFYTALTAGAYLLFSLFFRERRAPRLRFAVSCAVMAVSGLLIAALQILPARELHAQGGRAQLTYEYFSSFSLPISQTWLLIFPYFFGGAAKPPYHPSQFGTYSGYVGLTGLLLVFFAITGARRNRQVTFWSLVAAAALLLSFGASLPFGLNQLLYRIPVYNTFRGSYRHLYEFTFACAVVAGWGVNELAQAGRERIRRLIIASAALVSLVTATAVAYGRLLPLRNAEAVAPIILCVLALVGVWFFARRTNRISAAALWLVLLVDLASFGQFFEWRNAEMKLLEQLKDPAPVALIKSRESDLASFRVFSFNPNPFTSNYASLNYPNISIVRGLQSVNGYDVLRLWRVAAVAGGMDEIGIPHEIDVFKPQHRGLDLLGVKYLLAERQSKLDPARALAIDGVLFNPTPLNLKFTRGTQAELGAANVPATELAVVSSLGNGAALVDGTPVLRVKLRTADGRVIERELQAGRDTAEWAYDRRDVAPTAKHRRANVAESWPEDEFQGHRYLARLTFDRASITGVEFKYLLPEAELLIARASLYDPATNASQPLDGLTLLPDRWRKLAEYEGVEVYENVRARPRAWLVGDVVVRPSAEVLGAVKTGRLSDGAAFDPARTALLEREDFGGRAVTPPPTGEVTNAAIKVTRYEPQRIELETQNAQAALLVVSEVYYRGWEARVDGERAAVLRADYALRGVAVPGGKHRVEFYYRAPSLRAGANLALLGALLLIAGAFVTRRFPYEPSESNLHEQSKHKTSLADEWRQMKAWMAAHHSPFCRAVVPTIALLGLLALGVLYGNRLVGEPIRSDGVGYYLYLPAALIHGDLTLENVMQAQFGGKAEEWLGVKRFPETGRYLNRYALGESLLLAPFVVAGHLAAWLFGYKRDGFSPPYQFAAAIAGWFYFVAGLLLLKRVLERHFSRGTAAVTLLAMTFGTNLFHYGTCDNIFTHVYAFFLYAALLYLLPKWYDAPNVVTTCLLGLAAGFIITVRPTNGLFLVYLPLLGAGGVKAMKERLRLLWRHAALVALWLGVTLLTVAPLLMYWKAMTGHWFVNAYQGLAFNFGSPQIVNVLFSVRKGLFFWSPILLLAVAGFCFVERYWRGFLLPTALFLLAHLYVISSWPNWWYGGSFGHRAFTESVAVFAVGFAALLERLSAVRLLYRAAIILSVALMLLSVKFMIQYWLGVIPYDGATLEVVASTFFRFSQ